jgi:hypothetical protein
MKKTALAALVLLSACGGEDEILPIKTGKDVVIVDPKPKTLEVGMRAKYVLDPKRSSDLVKSGYMNVEVTGKDEKFTYLKGNAVVQTVVGEKDFEMTNGIENEILTVQFMADLRTKKKHQATEFLVEYQELTPEGCDRVKLTNIKGMDDAVLEPAICIASRQVPELRVTVRTSGMTVPVTFRAVT